MTPPFTPMTKEAVAAILDCTTRTIENLVKSGAIPAPTLLAGRVFWHPEVFYSWLDSVLRGGGTVGLCDAPAAPRPEPEIQAAQITDRPNSHGKSNDPASRMKAKQAARMAFADLSRAG